MKKLRFLLFALFTVLACVGIVACGDDDNDGLNGFANSSWKVVSFDDDSFSEDNFPFGVIMQFNKNGDVIFSSSYGYDYDVWPFAKWIKDGEDLTIILGQDAPDDKLVGKFIQNGKKATYVYHWADAYGEWEHTGEVYTLTLTRL